MQSPILSVNTGVQRPVAVTGQDVYARLFQRWIPKPTFPFGLKLYALSRCGFQPALERRLKCWNDG